MLDTLACRFYFFYLFFVQFFLGKKCGDGHLGGAELVTYSFVSFISK
jgi:hypothetical protein